MKYLIIIALWFALGWEVFEIIAKVTDKVYYELYYSKQTKEKQQQIDEWLKNDTITYYHNANN